MQQRSETLQRRIALYRRYLSHGIDADLARQYLDEISAAEAELAAIEQDTRSGFQPGNERMR